MNHTLHDAFDADYGGGDPKPKKLNAVQKYFDYNDDGKISNFEIGLGVVDLGVTIFDIVSIPSGEGVATHLALKQSAKSLTTKTVVKTSTKLIDDTAKQAKNWLGSGYKTVTNKAGDNIFMSKDGLRKIRFDIKNSHGDKPHILLEEFVNGKWRDAIKGTHRIYPKK